jgi:glycosyltransferase involved in cell wall biosynthesis
MEKLGNGFELLYTNTNSKNLILHKNMKPLPYLNSIELAQLYSSVDALIFPSRLEGFGLVVAEAMACGLPVIIANSSALTELVDHNITGFLCEKDNIDDFVKTILHLRDNPKLCKTIGENAKNPAIEKFNISSMIENYILLYTSVLN